jgi:hypothetical protein
MGHLQIMADAAAAVLLLIVNTTLAAFKPRGMTRYGRRKQYQKRISAVANVYAPELSETPAHNGSKRFQVER